MKPIAARTQTVKAFESGQVVTASGIYRIPHFTKHGRNHDVIMRHDDKVPHCPICGASMTFELVRIVPQITEDPDFQGEN